MRKVQMFGAEKIEVEFDGAVTSITITNNKSKMSAGFNIGSDRVVVQTKADHVPNGKALARALAIYDTMTAGVLV